MEENQKVNKTKKVLIFETTNLDLAAYLLLNGIQFIDLKANPNNLNQIILRFLDEKTVCGDLERVFYSSDFKKYKDLHKYLLKQVHNHKRATNGL